ncbi:hypothetical protein, partial [Mesorhizobium sp. M1A.F.Ca.IN.020.03.1.1]|uniref:hypothetical protein n=1 Tax=Mesorhizobium sp. M1A.F.Ca.IN.020.03.1.1 TaxID=2496764 RepID=UPI001FE024EF
MLAVDHLPQVAASGETTRPDLSVLDSGLLQLACIDRGNSDALPPHADRVAVDHTPVPGQLPGSAAALSTTANKIAAATGNIPRNLNSAPPWNGGRQGR